MQLLIGTQVVRQAGLVKWGEQIEVTRRVGHADVKEAHVVAGGAIAFVEAHGGRIMCGVTESGGGHGYKYDITHIPAMAGAVVGTAGWWGSGSVGGC